MGLSIHSFDRVRGVHRLQVDVITPSGPAAYSVVGKTKEELGPLLECAARRVRQEQSVATLGPLVTIRARFALRQAGFLTLELVLCAIPAFALYPSGSRAGLPMACLTVFATIVAVAAWVRLRDWQVYHDGRAWQRGVPSGPSATHGPYRTSAGLRQAALTTNVVPKPLRLFANALVEAFRRPPEYRERDSKTQRLDIEG